MIHSVFTFTMEVDPARANDLTTALHEDDGKKRGLHFICFNSDLQRQFEFVQQTWANNPQFGGLANEVDPLIGDQSACAGMFTVQADPLRTRYRNLCRFVTMRGGVYGFLPGIRALRWLST